MNNNEVKIIVPEGMEIDKENSTFECIKFKPKELTYEDIMCELANKFDTQYYIGAYGEICEHDVKYEMYSDANNAYSEKQLEKVLAFNKLLTVAKYLNGDWKPSSDNSVPKHFLCLSVDGNISITVGYYSCYGSPIFKTEELAKRAIHILGEDTIKLALTNDY